MSDALRGNPIALRSCILYDFLLEKPADESYESLCSVVGSDALPREEFDFWLNRFGNGNFALEFEFSDLPTDVLKVIIEKLELKERFILRKVSHGLRSLVDQVRPNFETLDIRSNLDHIWLYFDDTAITYAGPDFKPKSIWEHERYVINKDYREMCLKDLHISLKNPMLKLEKLEMNFGDTIHNASNFYGDIGRLLESIDHRCHVKSVDMKIPNQDGVLSILQHLIPGVLNNISLFSESDQLLQIDKLTETEQWKLAEDVWTEYFKIQEPIESFYHLRHFSATWNLVTPEMLKGLRDTLSESVNFKYCWISSDDEIKDVELIMGTEENVDDTLIYPIPNSTDFLATYVREGYIAIKKRSKD